MGKYGLEKACISTYFTQRLADHFQSKLRLTQNYNFRQCAKIIRGRIYEFINCAKIKGAKINREKIRGAQNLMGLR